MKNVFERLGLVEGAIPAPEEDAAPVHAAQPITSFATPSYTAPASPAQTLAPEDQDRLKALEAQVYAAPSSYVIFRNVRQTLGNTSDLRQVFQILTAANPGVTPAKVLADIDAHLGIVAQKRSEFDAQITSAQASRIDGPVQEVSQLTAANQELAQKIATNTARITQLQSATQDAQKAITDGAARFKLIEDQLSAPLLQTKQLLSSIS